MIDEDSKYNENSQEGNDPSIVIIPIKTRSGDPEKETKVFRSILSKEDVESHSSSYQDPSFEERINNSKLSIYGTFNDANTTANNIKEHSQISGDDESIEHLSKCAAFWQSLGTETLVYMVTYGGGILANGLIIRFAGFNPFISTLIFGSYSALSFNQAQVLFSSCIKPPKDVVPEDRQECFKIMSKYAFLPVSWVVRAGVAGTALSLIGDTDFGTQQAISVPSSLLIGPVTTGLRTLTRECLGGSIEIQEGSVSCSDTTRGFETAYSTKPNPLDEKRTYKFGTLRDAIVRGVVMNMGTLAFFAFNGSQLSTYCFGAQNEFLNATKVNNTTNINDLLNEHCPGGQFTFMFRELALSFTYGVGVLVVEPLLGALCNKIYDYFYSRDDGSSDDEELGPRIEEISDDK